MVYPRRENTDVINERLQWQNVLGLANNNAVQTTVAYLDHSSSDWGTQASASIKFTWYGHTMNNSCHGRMRLLITNSNQMRAQRLMRSLFAVHWGKAVELSVICCWLLTVQSRLQPPRDATITFNHYGIDCTLTISGSFCDPSLGCVLTLYVLILYYSLIIAVSLPSGGCSG